MDSDGRRVYCPEVYPHSPLPRSALPLQVRLIRSYKIGRRGLLNLGQTCFLNVILQSFIHNPLLRNYFLSDRHNSRLCKHSDCTCCEMDNLFTEVSHNKVRIAPVKLFLLKKVEDLFPNQYPIWAHVLPRHNMESFCRDVRLCPTRRTRIFHHRTEPNSRNMPWLHEYLVQLHHSSDFRRSIPKRRHM
jgi:hypothetical protein